MLVPMMEDKIWIKSEMELPSEMIFRLAYIVPQDALFHW